jgi:hypothetical protein
MASNIAESVDLAALPPNVPSLCIPRVFKNINRERVFNCFKDLGIGFIERIDMVPRTAENGEQFQRVFVHLRWNRSDQASKARARLLGGKEIKIVYDEPWFWKVSANRSVSREKPPQREKSHDKPRATLALDDDDDEHEDQDTELCKIKAQNDKERKGDRKGDRKYKNKVVMNKNNSDYKPLSNHNASTTTHAVGETNIHEKVIDYGDCKGVIAKKKRDKPKAATLVNVEEEKVCEDKV